MRTPDPNNVSVNASDHPIKSVTIFQSSMAEMSRRFVVSLKSGQNIVEITGISSEVDTESPRIHDLNNIGQVFDVCCYIRTTISPQIYGDDADVIEELKKKKARLGVERLLLQQESRMLKTDNFDTLYRNQPMPGVEFETLLDRIANRKGAAMNGVIELDEKISKVEEEIAVLDGKHQGEADGVVSATIHVERGCEVTLQLTYLISGATWRPYYDLHASTKDGKPSSDVLLQYCAHISQETGEDWSGAALTLSTATSQTLQSLSVPAMESLKITATSPAQHRSRSRSRSRSPPYSYHHGPRPRSRSPLSYDRQPRYVVHRTSLREHRMPRSRSPVRGPSMSPRPHSRNVRIQSPPDRLGVVVDSRNPLSLAFRVGKPVSLPSDGRAHKVWIATLDFAVELQYICVPRQKEAVFIEASITNTSEYELLPGPVSVFMDNAFVTRTSLGLIGVNESFECALGVDTACKVAYRQDSRTEEEPARNFAEPTKTTTRTVTTTVTNGHQLDISPLIVRDVLPLGDDGGKVKVTLRNPEGLARAKEDEEVTLQPGVDSQADVKVRWAKDVDGKRGEKDGMYEWVCAVPAGKKVVLEAEWDIKAAANVKWEEIVDSK